SQLPGPATAAPARLASPAGAAVSAETQPGILGLPRNYIRSMPFTVPHHCDNSRGSPTDSGANSRTFSLCGALVRFLTLWRAATCATTEADGAGVTNHAECDPGHHRERLRAGMDLRHTDVVKYVGMTGAASQVASTVGAATGSAMPAGALAQIGGERSTRARIARLILENGPVSAAALSTRLGLTPAAVRRHLDGLLAGRMPEVRN